MVSRKLTLTATTFNLIEDLRLTLEIQTGASIRIKELEFEKDMISGHGSFYSRGEEIKLIFIDISPSTIERNFELKIGGMWFVARFDTPEQVRVIEQYPTSGPPTWIVGTSMADRRTECLYPVSR